MNIKLKPESTTEREANPDRSQTLGKVQYNAVQRTRKHLFKTPYFLKGMY